MQTDMKMYEIGEAVGYGSVEHFNHIFNVHKSQRISPEPEKLLTIPQEIQRYFMEKGMFFLLYYGQKGERKKPRKTTPEENRMDETT